MRTEIHGYKIIGSVEIPATDITRRGQVILVDKGPQPMNLGSRYVTACLYGEDKEWSNGNYFVKLEDAVEDFFSRTKRNVLGKAE